MRKSQGLASVCYLNSDLRPFGVAFGSPASSGPERSRGCKGVFHELHVSAAHSALLRRLKKSCGLPGDFGVENVTIVFPITLDFLHNENFAVAFRTGRFLAFWHNRSVRAGADEPKVIT